MAASTRHRTRIRKDRLLDSTDDDVSYFYESRLPGEIDPVADIHFHPVEPRNARLHVRWHLE